MNQELEEKINTAFSRNTIPEGKLCSSEYDYEDTHFGFTGTTWQEHDALFLRKHASSLSFFTAEAFHYYLPAFMMAELKAPDTADIIAESIAFHLTEAPGSEERIKQFSREELLAVVAFFNLCAARYNDGIYDALFNSAAELLNRNTKAQ
ncbi:DUF6714 family protein [Kaarinaea lacus]